MNRLIALTLLCIISFGCTEDIVPSNPDKPGDSDLPVLPDNHEKLDIIFDDQNIGILPGSKAQVGYKVQGASKPTVKALGQNGWSAKVIPSSDTEGLIQVKAPSPLTDDEIVVIVSDGEERTKMATIQFVAGVIKLSPGSFELSSQPGTFKLSLESNLRYSIYIPESDKKWISCETQTKSMTDDTYIFSVTENKGLVRNSTITFLSADGETSQSITVIQKGTLSATPSLTILVEGIEIPLIKVNGGTFTMGATPEQGDDASNPYETPAHQVTLSDYYIAQYKVTAELWNTVMEKSNVQTQDQNSPVYVIWSKASDFVSKLNAKTGKRFTLPTEAQWEFAARGGIHSQHHKYSGSDTFDLVGWKDPDHPVGMKLPNELGIYDMTGNGEEWCDGWLAEYTSEPEIDPQPSTEITWRCLRGGRVSQRMAEFNGPRAVGIRLCLKE